MSKEKIEVSGENVGSDYGEHSTGGSGSYNDDGSVHYTDYDGDSGTHHSWDEKDGEVKNEHVTIHGTDEKIDEEEANNRGWGW